MKESSHQKNTVRLNFEFPSSEYPHLKMVLASKRLSLRDFATNVLVKAIEEAEDEILAQKANERLDSMQPEDIISWDEATRLAGWDNDKV